MKGIKSPSIQFKLDSYSVIDGKVLQIQWNKLA